MATGDAQLGPLGVQQQKEGVFMDAMDSFQEYLDLHATLQSLLKQGLLDIARAKYSMGSTQLSSEQYDMEMEASTLVTRSTLPGDDTDFASFALDATLPVVQRAACSSELHKADSSCSSSRTQPDSAAATGDGATAPAAAARAAGAAQAAKLQDPLAWFGVLVPPTLRSAQQSFCKALATAVALSNRQQLCLQRCQQFEELCNQLPSAPHD